MCSIRETRLLLARCLASGLVALTQAFDAVVKFLAIIDIPVSHRIQHVGCCLLDLSILSQSR